MKRVSRVEEKAVYETSVKGKAVQYITCRKGKDCIGK